ncbi:MAG: NAD(P)-dependent oxidoreductase [Polaromonas sp.]|nr:NAD(P)-dependent oxidoreductase [Polaromonas sp.]
MTARTILVTGGAGFIAGYFALELADTHDKLVMLDVKAPGPESEWMLRDVQSRITYVKGGVDDAQTVLDTCRDHGVTDIVHMASIVNPAFLASHPKQAFDINVGGTMNVLAAMHQLKLRRLVCFSTIGVLPAVQYEPIDANHPVLLGTQGPGASFYGAAKVASEAFCFAYRQSFGLDFVIIRPSAVYGFGMQWPIYIKPVVENSIAGIATRFPHGHDFPRDYTHAADVAQVARRALDAPAAALHDRIFYGASGAPLVTAGQMAQMVRDQVPGADIEIGPGLSADDLVEISYRGVLDVETGRRQLGYVPRFASLRDGIADYIATHRRYLAETQAARAVATA